MKRLLCLVLTLGLLLGLSACAGDVPETQPTEAFVSNTLIQDGKCDYTIVHDGSAEAKMFAGKVSAILSENFGISLPIATAGESKEKQIVVGKVGTYAEKLRQELDFAMQVEEDALILSATDKIAYQYFAEYLQNSQLLAKDENGGLTLDSQDNFVYSRDLPVDENFIAYMRQCGENLNWKELFFFKEYKNDEIVLPYRLYVPFNHSPDKKLPLVVNLHGASRRGNDNQNQLRFLDPVLLNENQQMSDAIVVCPQCPSDQMWVSAVKERRSYRLDQVPESDALKAVVELVEQLMQEYPVDASRIYVCGLSMGGFGTWDLLMRHGDLFCAGVPMCGAGDPTQAEKLKDTPIWAVHGVKDASVPVSGSREMAQALQAVSAPNFHYTELPEHEHDVWTYTYANEEIFTWLFSQKKEG